MCTNTLLVESIVTKKEESGKNTFTQFGQIN
jgi:hypothetical protein